MNVYHGLNLALSLIGLYILIQAILMKKSGKVPSLLIAKEEENKIRDERALVEALSSPMLRLGIVMLLIGTAGFVFTFVWQISWFRYIQLLLFMLSWMYFMKKYQDAKASYIDV